MNSIICIHGAIGNKRQMDPFISAFSGDRKVYNLELPGHGNTPLIGDNLSFDLFTSYISTFMQNEGLAMANFLGYSMGGYAAVNFAIAFPDRVGKIMTIGTRWLWGPDAAAKECKLLIPDLIELKVPSFAKVLEHRHPNGWKQLLTNTADLLRSIGDNPPLTLQSIQEIQTPILICVGDRDTTAGIEESMAAFQQLPNGQFAILPNSFHVLEKMDLPLANQMADKFFFA